MINAGGATTAETLTIKDIAAVSMTDAQHDAFTTQNAAGTNTITITNAVSGTGYADVEAYVLHNVAGNDFTLGKAGQDVTSAGEDAADTISTGLLTAFDGTTLALAGLNDTLVVTTTGTDLSLINAGGATTAESLTLTTGARVIMTAVQNNAFTGAISAVGTVLVENGETITISGNGNVTTLNHIEQYLVGATTGADSGARTIHISSDYTSVIDTSANDAVTFEIDAKANVYTGRIIGNATVADTLSLVDGADISAADINEVGKLVLATDARVTMTSAQHASFTEVATTDSFDATIVLTDAMSGKGFSTVESYVLADVAGNVFTLGANAQNVSGRSTQNDTVNTGLITEVTGVISLGEGGTDTFNISKDTTGTGISTATFTSVEAITLASGVDATMTIAQNALISAATDINIVTLSDMGTLLEIASATGSAFVESYVLADGVNSFTMGVDGQNISASGGTLEIDASTFTLGHITETAPTVITLDMTHSRDSDLLNLDGASLANVDTLVLTAAQADMVENWTNIDYDKEGVAAHITDFVGGLNIQGSDGVQHLTGSAGDDVIASGLGADFVALGAIGGGGHDKVVFSALEANDVTVSGFTTGAGAGSDVLDFSSLTLSHNAEHSLVFNNYDLIKGSASDTVIGFNTLQMDTAEGVASAVQGLTGGLGEGSKIIFLVAQSANAAIGVWSWQDSNDADAGHIEAAELTLIGVLQETNAMAAMTAMTSANFFYNPTLLA